MAPNTNGLKMLRVVIREDFTRNRCDALIKDIKLCTQVLEEMDEAAVKRQQAFIQKHTITSHKSSHNHPDYKNEKHSLQGKTGKTHAIC